MQCDICGEYEKSMGYSVRVPEINQVVQDRDLCRDCGIVIGKFIEEKLKK